MNRRKAIRSFALLGFGVAAAYSGTRFYKWYKEPDLNYLREHEPELSALMDTLLPGSHQAKIAPVLIHFVEKCTKRQEQNTFIDGCQEVFTFAQRKMGSPFHQLSKEQQQKVLATFVDDSRSRTRLLDKVQRKLMGRNFYELMKEYTVIAFCTSEHGASRALAFDYIPGSFNGCMKMTPDTKAWSTK